MLFCSSVSNETCSEQDVWRISLSNHLINQFPGIQTNSIRLQPAFNQAKNSMPYALCFFKLTTDDSWLTIRLTVHGSRLNFSCQRNSLRLTPYPLKGGIVSLFHQYAPCFFVLPLATKLVVSRMCEDRLAQAPACWLLLFFIFSRYFPHELCQSTFSEPWISWK